MKRNLFNLHNNFHYNPELMEMLTPGEGFPINENKIFYKRKPIVLKLAQGINYEY